MTRTRTLDLSKNSNFQIDDFPALANLGVTNDELDALTRQGFVCTERRHANQYYKLRYRIHGKQRVRYVPAESARLVESELAVLQHGLQLRRKLSALHRIATEQLREAKLLLQPHLDARGFHYHGQIIRKRRAKACP